MKELITAQDFYDFFDAIPEDQWTQQELKKRKSKGNYCYCALGHLGTRVLTTSNKQNLIEPVNYTGYGYIDSLSEENVYRLGVILDEVEECKQYNNRDAEGSILSINDSLNDAISLFNLSDLSNIKPAQRGKLAKHNILKALKQIIDNGTK